LGDSIAGDVEDVEGELLGELFDFDFELLKLGDTSFLCGVAVLFVSKFYPAYCSVVRCSIVITTHDAQARAK
jgi:hypothetical protein